jgi:hypothetical protein
MTERWEIFISNHGIDLIPGRCTMYMERHIHTLFVNLVHCDTAHVQVTSIDVYDSIDSINIEERMIKIPEIFVIEQVVAWYQRDNTR